MSIVSEIQAASLQGIKSMRINPLKKSIVLGILLGSPYLSMANVGPVGFDPGMKKAVAYAYPFTLDETEFPATFTPKWICEGGIDQCQQNYASGYYSLTQDRIDCEIRTPFDAHHKFQNNPHSGAHCPSYFSWRRDQKGDLYSDLIVETSHLTYNPNNPSYIYVPYTGLQINAYTNVYPGGLPFSDQIPIKTLNKIQFSYRAKACIPTDKPLSEYSHGRVTYYFAMYNTQGKTTLSGSNGLEVAINLSRYDWEQPEWMPGGVIEPGPKAGWECINQNNLPQPEGHCNRGTIQIDAPSWQLTDENWLQVTRKASCSVGVDGIKQNEPFREVTIDVKDILQSLINQGFVSPDYFDDAVYVGGILGGIEYWGPALVQSHVKGHTLFQGPAFTLEQPSEEPLPVGKVLLAGAGMNVFYRNQQGEYCRFVNDEHAGNPNKSQLPLIDEYVNSPIMCPGHEYYEPKLPVGKVLLAGAGMNVFYRNQQGEYCRFVNDEHAGNPNKSQLPLIDEYVNSPIMCPGHEYYQP